MSANDTAAEQAAASQGQDDKGIFDTYLASVPEEHRETVAGYLKDAEKEVNGRFQEAATLQSQFEPFTTIEGLDNYDAETLGQLISWHTGVQAEGGLEAFVKESAKELGLTFAEAQELQESVDAGAISPEMISEAVAKAVTPLQERLDARDANEQRAQIIGSIESDFAEIETANKIKLSEEEKAMILDLASSDGFVKEPDWINKGFERFQGIRGLGAEGLLSDATQQPGPGLTAGAAEAVEPITDFATAGEQAKEMIRRNRG